MRKAIRQRLIDKIPEIAGRVYEPSMAGPSTKKPYIVLKYGGDIAKQIEVSTEEVAVDIKARGKIASIYNRGDTPVLVSFDRDFDEVEATGDYRIIDAGVNIIYGSDVRVTCDTLYLKTASGSTSVEVNGYKEGHVNVY